MAAGRRIAGPVLASIASALLASGAQGGGIQFDETMKGYLSTDPEFRSAVDAQTIEAAPSREASFGAFVAQRRQKGLPTSGDPRFGKTVVPGEPFDLVFRLNVKIADSQGMAVHPDHAGALQGELDIRALSARPLRVVEEGSEFQLFADTSGVEGSERPVKKMRYLIRLRSQDEAPKEYFFYGFKHVVDDRSVGDAFEIWQDTSTLYVTVFEGPEKYGPVAGRGMMRILPHDFAVQTTTFRPASQDDVEQFRRDVAGGRVYGDDALPEYRSWPIDFSEFVVFFAGSVLDTHYPMAFKELGAYDPELIEQVKTPGRVPAE
jgi:hypothetical protein